MADEKFHEIDDLTSDDGAQELQDVPEQEEPRHERKNVYDEYNRTVNEHPKPARPAARSESPKRKIVPLKRKVSSRQAKRIVKRRAAVQRSSRQNKDISWLTWTLIILGIAIVVFGVLILTGVLKFPVSGTQADTVAALVNGEPISNKDVDERQSFVRSTSDPFISREDTLNQLIEERLLLQAATKEGFTITDEEVDAQLNQTMQQNGITLADLRTDLESKGTSFAHLVSFYKSRLTIAAYVNATILSKIEITDEDARNYYDNNTKQFETPAGVQVRHILVAFMNGSDNETFLKAKGIFDEVKDKKGMFCEFVTNYSDDRGSVPFCGEFNFTKQDPLVPEFVDASFSMKPDEIRIVKTQFGYHIIYKLKDVAGGVTKYGDVDNDIKEYLRLERSFAAYSDMLANLRRDAIIEIYSGDQAPDVQKPADVEAPSTVKETVQTEAAKKVSLAQCLTEKGAKLYQTYWCPDCLQQLEMFGEDTKDLTIVECDPEGENADPAACVEAAVKTYPTWTIANEKYEGVQSLRKLAQYSGCEY